MKANSEKRVVLITGASSGIGEAACEVFSANGWYVIGAGRRKIEHRASLADYLNADVSKPQDLKMIADHIKDNIGRLDSIVNNAALQICKPIIETSIEEWDHVYDVNVKPAFLLAKHLYPLLKKSGGSIVNVASVHAVATSMNIAAYASSKGALTALTRSMAIEFAKDNIRVNAVLPGAVDTPMLREGLHRGHVAGTDDDNLVSELGKKHIIGRVGRPKEIGEAIYFFADNERSSFVTGQTLIADGGALTKLSTE